MGSTDNAKSGVAITFPSDQTVNIKTPENPKQVDTKRRRRLARWTLMLHRF
jgi:hypothetical protein